MTRRTTVYYSMGLFREVVVELARELGFVYPMDLDQRVTTFAQNMRNSGK